MAKQKSVSGTKADPTIKFAKLVIDEATYDLCYSFNAIALAEAAAGCNLLSGLESLSSLTALQLRGLLYAALTTAHPDFTIEDAGNLVRLDTISSITSALGEAYVNSMPKKKESTANPPEASAPAES